MKSLHKKISVVLLSGVVLLGGALGSVSNAYSNSIKSEYLDQYVMDKGYQKLLKFKVLGYSLNIRDALKIAEDYANDYFPKRNSDKNIFKSGYEFMDFLIKYPKYFKIGIYVLQIGDCYYVIMFY